MLKLGLTPKNLFRLLMLMGKRLYTNREDYGDISTEELCQSLECDHSELSLVENLVKVAGTHMWSIEEFREHLSTKLSQEVDLSADHKTVLEKFWTDTRHNIATVVQRDACFNNTYENLAWRVDMKIASSKYNDINEPTAFSS